MAPAPNGSYLAAYRDEAIGQWAARHGLDGNQFEAEFDQQVAAGLLPLVVQAGGAWGGTRYASLFVCDDNPDQAVGSLGCRRRRGSRNRHRLTPWGCTLGVILGRWPVR